MPAIIDLQAAGKLKAAIEEDTIRGKNLIFDRYHVLARFLPCPLLPGRSPCPPPAYWWASWDRTSIWSWASTPRWDSAPRWVGIYRGQFLQVEEGVYENGVWKMAPCDGSETLGGP